MTRLGYGLWRLAYGIGSAFSRAFNHIVLGGSTHQTTSARCHVDVRLKKLRVVIDAIATPFERDHCANAWASDVAEARRTLEVNDALFGVKVE